MQKSFFIQQASPKMNRFPCELLFVNFSRTTIKKYHMNPIAMIRTESAAFMLFYRCHEDNVSKETNAEKKS